MIVNHRLIYTFNCTVDAVWPLITVVGRCKIFEVLQKPLSALFENPLHIVQVAI